jgi:hypothetical protein
MRAFTVDARYRAYIESTLARAIADVINDVERREDEDPRIQRLATVPDQFIDPTEAGHALTILVSVPAYDTAAAELVLAAGALS